MFLLTVHCFPLPPAPRPLPIPNGQNQKTPIVDDHDQKHETTRNLTDASSTLFFSLQTHNIKLRLANILINTLLLAAVLDFTLTPFLDAAHDVAYTRVGAVYPDSIKIQVRHPANETLVVLYREASQTGINLEWKQGPKVQPEAQFDWVDIVRLTNLWPSTKYECQSSFFNNKNPLNDAL